MHDAHCTLHTAHLRRHQDDLGPLPEGWEERVHTDGRIFFIDHNTRYNHVKRTIQYLMKDLLYSAVQRSALHCSVVQYSAVQ